MLEQSTKQGGMWAAFISHAANSCMNTPRD